MPYAKDIWVLRRFLIKNLMIIYGSVASIIEDLLEATKLRFWTLCNH
ncbi:MAG: hypothetical protein QMO91_08175 [Candidatus Tisiphia sp.]|nr:hypothetical protein [Candidatus Tisiphia sp.]